MNSIFAAMVIAVGSYGPAGNANIHTFEFDTATGTFTPLDSVNAGANPSFLAAADGGATLLAINENNGPESTITLMRADAAAGSFAVRAVRPLGADGPCHVAVAPSGRYAVAANYTDGSVTVVPFDGPSATLGDPVTRRFTGRGPIERRQDCPRAHFTSFTPDGRLMIVDDLGTDRLHLFGLRPDGFPDLDSMRDIAMTPASGPRHLAFDPSGRFAYVIGEIDGMVTRLDYDPDGATLVPRESVPADYQHGGGSADIHFSPDGRFLYVSNRLKGDGIVCLSADPATGRLSPAGFTPTGIHPRNFLVTPDGGWILVACRDAGAVEIYRRDPADGSLSPAGRIPCDRPVCVIAL